MAPAHLLVVDVAKLYLYTLCATKSFYNITNLHVWRHLDFFHSPLHLSGFFKLHNLYHDLNISYNYLFLLHNINT